MIVRYGAIGMSRSSFHLCCAMRVFGPKSSISNSSSSFYSGILEHLTKAAKLPLTGPLIRHTKMPLLIKWDRKRRLKDNSNVAKYSIFYPAKSS